MPKKVQNTLINCVCTANICRSPMAERLLIHALNAQEKPWNSFQVISSGTFALAGNKASPNAIKALEKVGLDLSDHRSQPITKEIIKKSILTLCMTGSHRRSIKQLYPYVKSPVLLIRELMPQPQADPEVLDPFSQNLDAYEACRDSIVEAIPFIIRYLKKNFPQKNEN
jgi:protein arginine phosphatase